MIAFEMVMGVVGATLSVGSGLISTLKKNSATTKANAVVTIQMNGETLQKKGSVQAADVPKMLGFLANSESAERHYRK